MKKYINSYPTIISVIVCFLISSLFMAGCSNSNTSITEEKFKSDLIGQKVRISNGVVDNGYLSADTIKSLKIVDKKQDGDKYNLIANVDWQAIMKGLGDLNKQNRRNDLQAFGTVRLEAVYAKYDKDWQLESVNSISKWEAQVIQVPNLIKVIPFEIDEKQLKNDLSGIDFTINYSWYNHLICFDKHSSELISYIPNTINQFKIVEIKNDPSNEIKRIVELYVDFDYKVKESIYGDNGNYNAKGTLNVEYTLAEDSKYDTEKWLCGKVTANKDFVIKDVK
ncbi:MAG: hypothetical protein ABFD18_16140 [Syntrophomonas sp.]